MSTFRRGIITPALKRIAEEYKYDGEHIAIDLNSEVAPVHGETKYYYTLVNEARNGVLVQWTVKSENGRFRLVGLYVVESDSWSRASTVRRLPESASWSTW